MGTGVLSRGVKRPDHDAYHSPPFSDETRNEWRYTSTPLACLYGLEGYSFNFNFFTKTNEILKITNCCVLKGTARNQMFATLKASVSYTWN
jgi:hypothetical protein